MKREIKFRRSHYFDEEKTKFSHFSYWGKNIGGTTFTSPSSNNYALYFEDDQFTGLKDKNGVEIYEGDIMAWEQHEGTKHQTRWIVKIDPLQPTKNWSSGTNKLDEIVIGNIHENPELI